MILIKAEHPEKGIWYFSTAAKAARYIGCTHTHLKGVLVGLCKRAKGWTLEYTDDGNIINKYIDPEK